jgi:parallel beta-helix repeat protein
MLKKIILALLALLCVLSVLPSLECRLSAIARNGTLIVDSESSDPSIFRTIQAAIDNATSGDTILVRKGAYNESVEVTKSVFLVGEDRDQTVVNGQDADFVISIMADDVSIKGFTIRKSFARTLDSGIRATSNNNTISHNKIIGIYDGIVLSSSVYNTVSDNIMISNSNTGASLYWSSLNEFSDNAILNNTTGISLVISSNNKFSGNTVANNSVGVSISLNSPSNAFYRNNFYDAIQIWSGTRNVWDYAGEGNFWSNFNGTDSDPDGIADVPYIIDESNRDNNPLMGMFYSVNVVLSGQTYYVVLINNSTVTDLGFEVGSETGNKMIRYDVSGEQGTIGFSRIEIPVKLMNYSFILAGEEEITPTVLSPSSKGQVDLYFTYLHSNQTVAIVSSKTISLYDDLLEKFRKLQNDLGNLTLTYSDLLSNYTSFLDRYNQLRQDYLDLNASYYEHLSDYRENLENTRNLMYIFAGISAVFIVATVYLSKRAHARTARVTEDEG